jgi:hypothetical protein
VGFQRDVVTALQSMAGQTGGPGTIWFPLSTLWLASTGVQLAVFADGASATPGTQLTDSEALTIRWNNHATPTAVGCQFLMPRDCDTNSPMVLNALCGKTGATVGDATTLTVAAYNSGVVGALHDADANFGGVSNALTGNATAKTVAHLTRTLAAADLAPYPASTTITLKPTDGLLGTDDFLLHAVWLTYTRRNPLV